MTNDRLPAEPSEPAAQGPESVAGPALDLELSLLIHGFTAAQRAPSTRHEYEKGLNRFLLYKGVANLAQLAAVTPEDVVDYRNHLQARGLAPSTVNGRIVILRGLFGKLVAEKKIPANPADTKLIKGLQVSDVSRTEGLSVDEVKAILATCDGTLRGLRDRALLMTLFYEGLRRSEASKLRYRDITTKKGLIEVKGAKNNPYDTVRMRPDVRKAIEAYLEVLNRELRKPETKPDDPVFCSLSRLRSFGKRLAPSSINELVKERARRAGITRRITAHSWRHTCTTQALQAGVPLQQVQRHLRHKNVETTLRYDREREARKNPAIEMIPDVE